MPPSVHQPDGLPQAETVKYLGLHFDKHLTWKKHVATKRKQLDHITREIHWLIGKYSPLLLENKLLIYKTVLKPVWTYGIELWGCATKSNIAVIQRYQSKLLRSITTPHGTSQIILSTSIFTPHMFTWSSRNGQLPIARPWAHAPTPSWNH